MSERIEGYHSHSLSYKSKMLDGNVDRRSTPKIGFELEVTCPSYDDIDDCFEAVDECFNDNGTNQRFCYEDDCSIGSGFECISRPASLNYWMDNFSAIENGLKALSRRRCVSHNNGKCGLHVHIDRQYFDNNYSDSTKQQLAEAKFLWLFEKHWENLVKFSRRRRFNYCRKLSDETDSTIPNLVKNEKSWMSRFVAVNITNSDTIEIRLWRGSLRPETVKATLKFSARLAELVKNKTVCELNNMTFEEILGDDEDILDYWETVKDRV